MQRLIQSALNVSRLSTQQNYPHGAVITLGGKIITSAANGSTSFCHAESRAVRQLCKIRA